MNYCTKPILVISFALGLLIAGCPSNQNQGPPQTLLDEMAAARAVFDECAPYSPTDEQSADYKQAITAAAASLDAGQYAEAMKHATRARLEAEQLHARLIYRELEKTHPAQELTYYYRDRMTASEKAEEAGDLDGAIDAAQEAGRQAQLSLEVQQRCFKEGKVKLDRLQKQIEQIFRVSLPIVQYYWAARDALAKQDCKGLSDLMTALDKMIADDLANKVYSEKSFKVQASDDYVRKYGYPAQYREITTQGLVGEVNRIHPGTKVTFIRCRLFSPHKTYYYVEDPATGIRGWMAEERLWPERAEEMK